MRGWCEAKTRPAWWSASACGPGTNTGPGSQRNLRRLDLSIFYHFSCPKKLILFDPGCGREPVWQDGAAGPSLPEMGAAKLGWVSHLALLLPWANAAQQCSEELGCEEHLGIRPAGKTWRYVNLVLKSLRQLGCSWKLQFLPRVPLFLQAGVEQWAFLDTPYTVLWSLFCLDMSPGSFLSCSSCCSPSQSFSFVFTQIPPPHHSEACPSLCSCSCPSAVLVTLQGAIDDRSKCEGALCVVVPRHCTPAWGLGDFSPTTVFPNNSISFPAAGQAETGTSLLRKKQSQELAREGQSHSELLPLPPPPAGRRNLSSKFCQKRAVLRRSFASSNSRVLDNFQTSSGDE